VRPDARETLDYFAAQGVAVKVISGDNAVSVGAVADKLGLHSQALDARRLPTDQADLADALDSHNTFGRVRPDQKRAIVHALQSHGHTVAMTGDGVNDVLALKDADIGVAMGAGSPASRAVAQIVLLDNKFATLPYVVGEGRRVIGNIERVASLFLTKTVYSALLALLVGIECLLAKPLGAEPLLYPFQPIHVTIAAWFTIGIPSFILSLAPNNERAYPGFVRRVLTSALPAGLVVGIATFATYLSAYNGADHLAGDRGLGAGGRGTPVRVVAFGAGHRVRGGVSADLQPAVDAAQVLPGPVEPVGYLDRAEHRSAGRRRDRGDVVGSRQDPRRAAASVAQVAGRHTSVN
jgi:cation-transporting ATPase E